MENICYLNGKMLPLGEATVSVRDLGFLRGYGVFDVMPVINGRPFHFEEHWDRFLRSAAELGLSVPLDAAEARSVMESLISRHSYPDMIVRTVLSGGPSGNGFLPEGKETFAIIIEAITRLPDEIYERGASVITIEHSRHIPQAKTTNYVVPISHRDRKERAGAIEILYVDDGRILEASTSNFFIVRNGAIRTTGNGVLGGITRRIALDLARELGIGDEEAVITLADLDASDEAFLTASNKMIVPVVSVDGRPVGDGSVGPVTRRLLSAYRKLLEEY